MEIITIIVGIIIIGIIAYSVGKLVGIYQQNKKWEKKILPKRLKSSRSIIGGQISEQLAPYFPDFPFKSSECRFIGKPFDFLVFEGLDEKHIQKVVFVEVKTGKSSLSSQEKHLKDAILDKRVEWFEWRLK